MDLVKLSRCPIANLLFAKHINVHPREANLSASAVAAILLIIFTSFLIDRYLTLRFILKSQHTRDIRRLFLFVRYNSHDSVMGMADDKFSWPYVIHVVMGFPRISAMGMIINAVPMKKRLELKT